VSADTTIYQRPAELLQHLIRFDTTNPPGNEWACVAYVESLLKALGLESVLVAKDPKRPNLIARLKGRGTGAPILLYGHVDVVTTANQRWTRPPFSGDLVDGYVWGRGAVDMKGGVAMMIAAFLRAKAEGLAPAGDIVLCILSDEEHGADFGARFLVDQHADRFKGIKYALGEFGGFPLYLGGKRFYPIQVAEKQMCWMKATVRGTGGHASMPQRGGTMARLSRLLAALEPRLPVHVTPAARLMFEAMSGAVPAPIGPALKQITNPIRTDAVLDQLGAQSLMFDAMLHHTVAATVVQGGHKVNVIPSEVTVELDGRMLPGFTADQFLAELRAVIGDDVELEVTRHDPGPPQPDLGMFDTLAGVLRAADPDGIPVPFLLPAVTDARHFAKLGIQTYGFLPMNLPEDFNFLATVHAADERVPARAVEFGANAMFEVLRNLTP
jgi:acetylornithine deacetylase/succinyl-diaminopimelate desuccinylase-like protein